MVVRFFIGVGHDHIDCQSDIRLGQVFGWLEIAAVQMDGLAE